MKKLLTIILPVLVFGCSGTTNLSRLSEEYFPLPDTGSYWVFKDTSDNQASVTVLEINYMHEGRYCSVWDFTGSYFYVWKDDGSVKTHRRFTKNFGGSSYILENRWADFIKLPLIDGDRWTETYTNSLNIAGVPYSIEIELSASVTELDNYTVPEGTFSDCYRIELTERIEEVSSLTGNQTSISRRSFILAPSKGIIYFSDSTGEYFLTDIELK